MDDLKQRGGPGILLRQESPALGRAGPGCGQAAAANDAPGVVIGQGARAIVEAEIDRLLEAAAGLIAMLDALDVSHEDLEEAHDLEHDPADEEPSLGSREDTSDQRCWSSGSCEDLEGPEDDMEPSMPLPQPTHARRVIGRKLPVRAGCSSPR